jgi:hypothetical protein
MRAVEVGKVLGVVPYAYSTRPLMRGNQNRGISGCLYLIDMLLDKLPGPGKTGVVGGIMM